MVEILVKEVNKLQEITLAAGIIGVIKAIKEFVPQLQGIVTLLVALGLGAIAGFYNLLGTPEPLTGIFIGAAAVGTVTVAEKVAGK